MSHTKLLAGALLLATAATAVVHAQVPFFGGKKIKLQRMLPPALELEAKSFVVEATSQDRAADAIAASFQEGFRAKIQGDDRFVYDERNPALRISIVITRYYTEAKQLTNTEARNAVCTTHTGTLHGTFRVVEVATGRPLASDTSAWKIQVGRTKQWLVSEDGRELNIKGPNEKLGAGDVWKVFEPESASGGQQRRLPFPRGGHAPHPCDMPLTQNEARDILADAVMTDIIQMAMPYSLEIEVPLPSNKAISRATEDAIAGEWTKALDGAIAAKELPKADDESERLYLIGLAYEALGYRDGQRGFEMNKRVRSQLPPDELIKVQAELRRIVDQAKESFDKSASSFAEANKKKDHEDYRRGERRADQSRRLYARIQKYRDMKPEPVTTTAVSNTLRMSDIIAMCNQGSSTGVITYRIEQAAEVAISAAELSELTKCRDKEDKIFEALRPRLSKKSEPAAEPAAAEKPAAEKTTAKPAAAKPAPKPATPPAAAKPATPAGATPPVKKPETPQAAKPSGRGGAR
jgi:hypothetical protein